MTKKELVERSIRALAAFDALPPEEQIRRLIANGTINEKGEVLMGGVEENGEDRPQEEGEGRCAPE
ncbi:MAG TPA: hypothetical protein VKA46_22385 [Gemmataceae bacterium]|nr:hypothetical protein [Gemmataceae bacterium]